MKVITKGAPASVGDGVDSEMDLPDAPEIATVPIVLSEGEELLQFGLRNGSFDPGVKFRFKPNSKEWYMDLTLFYNPDKIPAHIAKLAARVLRRHHCPDVPVMIAPLSEKYCHALNEPLLSSAKARQQK
jgi:hypothetical protein